MIKTDKSPEVSACTLRQIKTNDLKFQNKNFTVHHGAR